MTPVEVENSEAHWKTGRIKFQETLVTPDANPGSLNIICKSATVSIRNYSMY